MNLLGNLDKLRNSNNWNSINAVEDILDDCIIDAKDLEKQIKKLTAERNKYKFKENQNRVDLENYKKGYKMLQESNNKLVLTLKEAMRVIQNDSSFVATLPEIREMLDKKIKED